MKTDALISFLSTNPEPVDRRSVARTLSMALVAGTIAVLGIAFVGLVVRTDLARAGALILLAVKLSFAVGIVALASVYLMRLARPGGEQKAPSFPVILPFLGIVMLVAVGLRFAPGSHWDKMILGAQWLECLLSIPIIAIVPFAVAIWAMRGAAPTNLARAGAFAGLVAGGVSAMG